MKKTLVILICLTALAILFAYPVLASNNVLVEADSVSWAYDQNGSLVGTIIKTDGVPAGIPAHIAGQLVEGKIPKYERIDEKIAISNIFSFPTKVDIVQERTEITYSKTGGWKEFNLPPVVKESKKNRSSFFVIFIILPAICIFLITLFHFLNFGKIRFWRFSIFYGWMLFLILAAGWLSSSSYFLSGSLFAFLLFFGGGVLGGVFASLSSNDFLDPETNSSLCFLLGIISGFLFVLPVFGDRYMSRGMVWQYFLLFVLVCLGSCLVFYAIQGIKWLIRRHRAKSATTA